MVRKIFNPVITGRSCCGGHALNVPHFTKETVHAEVGIALDCGGRRRTLMLLLTMLEEFFCE